MAQIIRETLYAPGNGAVQTIYAPEFSSPYIVRVLGTDGTPRTTTYLDNDLKHADALHSRYVDIYLTI